MVFGISIHLSKNETETPGNFVDIGEDDIPIGASGSKKNNKEAGKPLLEEVTMVGSGTSKNVGGLKQWICNHCKVKYTSSYTRIHTHFFGAQAGKTT